MKIVADAHISYVEDYFAGHGELVLKPGRAIQHADVQDAEMLLVRSVTTVNKNLLENTRVRFVGSITAGADHLDTAWLETAGIEWCVAAGFNAPPVADYVISTIALLQYKEILAARQVKAAIIGVGCVGSLVAARLKQLGFTVVLCDPLRAEVELNFISTPLAEITDVDFIALHVPLTKTGKHATEYFIDKAFLSRQKPGCVLLNASRGTVIHTPDLLQYGTHLHWCLDVFANEPAIDKTLLANAIVATPHIAGYSQQSKIRGIDMIYRAAIQAQLLSPPYMKSLPMPTQEVYVEKHQSWRDIVLGLFNPEAVTTMLRAQLLPADEHGLLFDAMRQQFNARHELAFTHFIGAAGAADLLNKLVR